MIDMLWPYASLCLVAVWAFIGLALVCEVLGSHHLYGLHSHGQVALAVALCAGVATWLAVEVTALLLRRARAEQLQFHAVPQDVELQGEVLGKGAQDVELQGAVEGKRVEGNEVPETVHGGVAEELAASTRELVLRLDAWLPPLRAIAEVAAILAFAYLCDRTDVFSDGPKNPNKMHFWGVWVLVCVVALFTVKELQTDKPLQRQQSDEWKGWMQLMFLMYHYFEEKEVYNAIRIYIAAYVWMTGYGNFCYYARKGDFSSKRLLHTLFRLNFLGFCTCVVLNNEYMLYYICMMHTLFTLLVILALYIRQDLNKRLGCAYGKMFGLLVLMLLLYDGPYVIFKSVFGLPGIAHLARFHDPLHPEFTDELHEMHFRTGLDRFIWIIGMVFALHVPDAERFLVWVSEKSFASRFGLYGAVLLVATAVGGCWSVLIFSKEKYDYNAVHPYTSAIPIGVYLVLRNIVPVLRSRYLGFFAFLGKYTLETYIFQFHIWMRTTGINGSPKRLLVWVPGSYWVNFVVVTGVYVFVSIRFFKATVTLSNAFIPADLLGQAKAAGVLFSLGIACWLIASPGVLR